jgi:hypothetical protein
MFVGVFVLDHCQCELLQLACALRAAGSFTCGLNGRQQKRDEDPDDRDDDQEFDQRKGGTSARCTHSGNLSTDGGTTVLQQYSIHEESSSQRGAEDSR